MSASSQIQPSNLGQVSTDFAEQPGDKSSAVIPGAHGWMPIESAPKDGTEVILAWSVFIEGGTRWSQTIGCWEPQFESVWDDEADDIGGYRGAWTDHTVASWAYEQYAEVYPSHFQPLPKPPVSEASK